jgi:aldose 1-epimerase
VETHDAVDRAVPPSGRQHRITYGDHAAVVTQAGATLRACTLAGRPVLDGFEVDERAADGRGQVLTPWPNRLAEGRYTFDGRTCQAPINEPGKGNAIHGLVRWVDWTEVSSAADAVTLACAVRPQPAYEWQVDLRVEYRLDAGGLTVSTTATNAGTGPAPFGIGFHPYLTLGRPVDDLSLRVPAGVTLAPAGDPSEAPVRSAVAGGPFDLRTARTVGGAHLDTAYGDLERDDDGRAVAVLADPEAGTQVRLWVDSSFRYLMVYTGDDVGTPARRRQAVAVEPMTCPPHAFRSGVDVVTLDPGESWSGTWGLAAA